MWCVHYEPGRCRLFHDYFAAVRFYGAHRGRVTRLCVGRSGTWESLAWGITDKED